jgi:hypothetical protein
MLYGAVHNGEHLFYEDKESQPGIAKFSNVWQLEKQRVEVTSFSFDHQTYDIYLQIQFLIMMLQLKWLEIK